MKSLLVCGEFVANKLTAKRKEHQKEPLTGTLVDDAIVACGVRADVVAKDQQSIAEARALVVANEHIVAEN